MNGQEQSLSDRMYRRCCGCFRLINSIASGGWNTRMTIEGQTLREGDRPPLTAIRIASPDYFKTLGIPLEKGRMAGAVLVRTGQEGMSLANQMRRAVRDVDPQTAIPNVETLEQARADSMASPRVMTDLLGIFAGLALAIAAFGIGGILALGVQQRWNEIGIRIALGAKSRDVVVMILGQGMLLVVIGLGIGLAAAFGLTRLMKTLLFQVGPTDSGPRDTLTFVGVSAIFAITALVACYVPARRTLRIDPLRALRSE